MLSLKKNVSIFVCKEPVDFRKGIDGLSAICKHDLGGDPRSGSLFLFCNRRKNSIRILVYDTDGYWLAHKRFSKGKIPFWPSKGSVTSRELQFLLSQKSSRI